MSGKFLKQCLEESAKVYGFLIQNIDEELFDMALIAYKNRMAGQKLLPIADPECKYCKALGRSNCPRHGSDSSGVQVFNAAASAADCEPKKEHLESIRLRQKKKYPEKIITGANGHKFVFDHEQDNGDGTKTVFYWTKDD